MQRSLLLALSVCVCGVGATWAQNAPPQATFRTGTDLVSIDVTVLDRRRQPIRGLVASDFTIKEDGKIRPVSVFTAVELPKAVAPPAPWMRDVAADVVTNVVPREGRLVVIVVGGGRPDTRQTLRQAAFAAVDSLGPGDLAAVVLAGRGIPQHFTADRAELRRAIERPFADLPEDDEAARGQCYCNVCQLDAVTDVANSLRGVPERRKSVFMIGTNLSFQAVGDCSVPLKDARTRLFRALDVANVTVHSIDPTGLETGLVNAEGRRGSSVGPGRGIQARQANLGVLPDRTGGRTVMNTNDPARVVPAIFAESGAYYVLGFLRADGATDGRFHKIEVDVKRRGASVSTSRGYDAPGEAAAAVAQKSAPGIPAPMVALVDGLWPKTSLPLNISATAIAVAGQTRATVAIVVGARFVKDPSEGPIVAEAAGSGKIEVLTGAFDRYGKSTDYRLQTLSARLQGGSGPTEYEVLSRLSLSRGHHEIRVAVTDAVAGRQGSVYAYVDVPDFARAPLSVSGPVFDTTRTQVVVPKDGLADVLPIVPTARREFERTEQVRAFLRVYEGGTAALQAIRATATIRDSADTEVFSQERVIAREAIGADHSADYLLDVPTSRLRPGAYLLTFALSARGETVTRQVRLTIR